MGHSVKRLLKHFIHGPVDKTKDAWPIPSVPNTITIVTYKVEKRNTVMKYPLPEISTEPGMTTALRSAKQMYVNSHER